MDRAPSPQGTRPQGSRPTKTKDGAREKKNSSPVAIIYRLLYTIIVTSVTDKNKRKRET